MTLRDKHRFSDSRDHSDRVLPLPSLGLSQPHHLLVGRFLLMNGVVRFLFHMWHARFAASRLLFRNLSRRYRYSSLGMFWEFAPSILTMAVLMATQHAFILGHGKVIPAAFYGIFGVAMAQTFLDGINLMRNIIASNADLLRRINESFHALILASTLELVWGMSVRLLIIALAFVLFSVKVATPLCLLALVGFCGIGLLGAGIGLLVAPANALTRDIDFVLTIVPLGLIATTNIFFPANQASLLGRISGMNPLTWFFDGIRASAYGGSGSPLISIVCAVFGLLTFALGCYICQLLRPHVQERMIR